MKERVVVYARYSSEKQTEQSIEGQIHVCTEYAEQNNMQIIQTYIDRAKTGRNDNREAFQQMLKDSAKHLFTTVLVYALDRFSRNRYDSAIHKSTLKKNGVRLISATQPISDNPEGILLESFLEGLAEYYSAELSQKLARGRRESIAKGQYIGGFVPYGYKIENKKYIIDENEAKTVKLIFQLFKKFRNYKDIVVYLQEHNIYNRKSAKFKQHQISNLLNNKIYTGLLQRGQNICENATPVIIPKEEFEEIQNIMKNSYIARSKSPVNFLLSGKVVCGECGANMIGDSGTGKLGKLYYYYCCQKRKISSKECISERIPKEQFERSIYKTAIEELKSEHFSSIVVKEIQTALKERSIDKRIQSLKKDLASIDKKLNNISSAIQNGIINDQIKKQNDELLDSKYQLEVEIDNLIKDPLNNLQPEEIKDYVINKYTKSSMETILNALIYKVYVYRDYVAILFNLRENDDSDNRKWIRKEFEYHAQRSTTEKTALLARFFVLQKAFA